MRKLSLTILLIALLITSGCSTKASINAFSEKELYNHPQAGFSIQVPNSWEKIKETDLGVDFVDKDKGIAANFLVEIGGLGYLTTDDLAEALVKAFQLDESFKNIEIVVSERSNINVNMNRVIFESIGPKQQELATKVFVMNYETGIRYYLVFTAQRDMYYRYDYEFEDLANTFIITKQSRELYQLITDSDLPDGHSKIDIRNQEGKEKEK